MVFDEPNYWYSIIGDDAASRQIQMPSNISLNSSASYLAVIGGQVWKSSTTISGSINASVAISTGTSFNLHFLHSLISLSVKWMFLSKGCFGATNNSFSYVNVPSDLIGKRAVAFRITYVNGTIVCDSKRKINSLWGYVFLYLTFSLISTFINTFVDVTLKQVDQLCW